MTKEEIKNRIDFNNNLIENMVSPNIFTLNNSVLELLRENEKLQDQCPHEFEDGFCKYCYRSEK